MGSMNQNAGDIFARLNPKAKRDAAIAGTVRPSGDEEYSRKFWGGAYDKNVGHYMPTLPLFGGFEFLPFFMHRTIDTDTTDIWTEAHSGTGTGLTLQDADGGRAKIVNGTGDNNYYTYFSNGEIVKLSANRQIYLFAHALKIKDVDQADWFMGLCAKLGSGNLFDNRVDAIGFYGTDGSALIRAETNKDGTASQVSTGQSLTDDTEEWLGLHINGTTAVYFYTGNARGYRCLRTASIPDNEELAVAFGCRNGQAAANEMTVGQIDIVRGR